MTMAETSERLRFAERVAREWAFLNDLELVNSKESPVRGLGGRWSFEFTFRRGRFGAGNVLGVSGDGEPAREYLLAELTRLWAGVRARTPAGREGSR
jgi:hypothetical protein